MALEEASGGGGGGGPGQVGAKKPWSKEEDRLLRALVQERGAGNWEVLCLQIPGRSGKSCRLRWTQHLDPSVDGARPFTPEEDAVIVEQHRVHGNRWATIASFLQGRSDNAVKNRWNTCLRKQQRPGDPCGAAGQAADGELTPTCLILFPLEPGFDQVMPSAFGMDVAPVAGHRRDVVPECLELFPLAPGDVGDNASAAAPMDVDGEAVCSLTKLRLAPPAAAPVFDAMPLQAARM
ncbi:hypothetical protein ABZP36_018573 [Zizania latifolia]